MRKTQRLLVNGLRNDVCVLGTSGHTTHASSPFTSVSRVSPALAGDTDLKIKGSEIPVDPGRLSLLHLQCAR